MTDEQEQNDDEHDDHEHTDTPSPRHAPTIPGSVPTETGRRDAAMIPEHVRILNRERHDRWHIPGEDDWTLGDWSNAVAGEVGEMANIVKKMRRHQGGAATAYNTPSLDYLRERFCEEVADVRLYLDLLCWKVGVTPDELDVALVEKFNRVSRAQGWDDLTIGERE